MKIAFIVKKFPSLSESFIINQITGLLDMQHDVKIFAELNPKEDKVHDNVIKYDLIDRTYYISSIPRNKFVLRIKTLILLFIYFLRNPIRLLKALITNFRNGDFNYKLLYFAFIFLGKRFDVIHCHFGPAGIVGSFLKKAGFEGKLITTFHGYDITSFINRRGDEVYRQLFLNGDLFTYNSEATKDKLIRLGCPSDKMVKLPMGVNLNKISFSEKKLLNEGEINILSVGRLVEMKGREYAIRAVAKVAGKNTGLRYIIVGDGPLRKSLQKLIDDLKMTEQIEITGWIDDKQLAELYKSSHIFLHPSITASDGNMEGQGVVLLEAQAYGIPVLATKHNAFNETVIDGQSGILVPEKNVDALVEKLEYLIDNPHLWPIMGLKGRQYVENKYCIKKLNKKLNDIYSSLFE